MLTKAKIAVVNMNGTPDFAKNFKFNQDMIEKAGKEKASMICLPEVNLNDLIRLIEFSLFFLKHKRLFVSCRDY